MHHINIDFELYKYLEHIKLQATCVLGGQSAQFWEFAKELISYIKPKKLLYLRRNLIKVLIYYILHLGLNYYFFFIWLSYKF